VRNLRSFAAGLALVATLAAATTACTENTGRGAAVGFIYDKVTGNDY
jgi:hypothetical protein